MTILEDLEKELEKELENEQKKTIYYAHPYDTWKTPKEKVISNRLVEMSYDVYNPFVEEDDVNEKYGVERYYDCPYDDLADEIKDRDFVAVDKCDAYFGWIPKGVATIGTVREFDRAIRKGKHTIILSYKPNPFLRDADELYLSTESFLKGEKYVWKSCELLQLYEKSMQKWMNLIDFLEETFDNEAFYDSAILRCSFCLDATRLNGIHNCDICKINKEICGHEGHKGIFGKLNVANSVEKNLKVSRELLQALKLEVEKIKKVEKYG